MGDVGRLIELTESLSTACGQLHARSLSLPPLPLERSGIATDTDVIEVRLAQAIYRRIHQCRTVGARNRSRTMPRLAGLVNEVREQFMARRSWWHGLRQLGADDDHVLVEWNSLRVRMRHTDVRPCSHLPTPALQGNFPSMLEGLLPGWILISGKQRPYDKLPQSRAYLNVNVSAAASVFTDVVDTLDSASVPVLGKICRLECGGDRSDSMIVQFASDAEPIVRESIRRAISAYADHMIDSISPFTDRIATGVGLALVPYSHEISFGVAASSALARAILAVARQSDTQPSWKAVEAELQKEGIDPHEFSRKRFVRPGAGTPVSITTAEEGSQR